jgi:hypothetical protein
MLIRTAHCAARGRRIVVIPQQESGRGATRRSDQIV